MLDAGRLTFADSFSKPISSASANLYQDLHERIEGALQTKQMIEADLAQPEAQNNTELRAILEKNRRDNHETLTKFILQLLDFGPLPFEFHQPAQLLRKAIAAQMSPADPLLANAFQQWEQEQKILEEPVSKRGLSQSPEPLPPTSENLAPKGPLRRLPNVSKDRGSKWFKRRA